MRNIINKKTSEDRYHPLFDSVQEDRELENSTETVWRCRKCGHIQVELRAPEVCPVCRHMQAFFEIRADIY